MDLTTVVLGIVIVALGILLAEFIGQIIGTNTPQDVPATGPKPSIAELLEEVNMLISLECVALIDIPQSVKAIPLINDFTEIQNQLVHNVVESLSTNMWKTFNRAGVKKEYVIKHITRRANAELLSFMEKNNYATVEDKEKFMEAVNGNER